MEEQSHDCLVWQMLAGKSRFRSGSGTVPLLMVSYVLQGSNSSYKEREIHMYYRYIDISICRSDIAKIFDESF